MDISGTFMAEVISGIPGLIDEGKKFNFQNFASKSPRGFPSAYSEDWLVWTHHVRAISAKMDESPISEAISRGLGTILLGYVEEDFQRAKDSILSGLRAAEKVFGEAIPASDRIVSIGHNSPEQTQALEKIDELVEAVRQANDLPLAPEEKEELVAELSAGRKLLEATKIRVTAVRATLEPALRWILEKAGGAVIGKMAADLWEYLVHLKF
jgi:hypothetical protein